MIPLTQHELKELLHYDQDSGLFTWKVFRCRSAKPGDVAGKTNHHGYRLIKIYGKYYHASRLAWLYVYGRHPDGEIDHINRVRNDNRIVNLREVSHRENSMNRGVRSDNKSGSKGVCKNSSGRSWRAYIKVNGKYKHLGNYADLELASLVAEEAREKYHAEFSSLQKPEGANQ